MSSVPDPDSDVDPARYGREWAHDYDELDLVDPAETAALIEVVAGLAGRGPVLDVAAATGRLAIPLARRGLRVVATDASPDMLARLRAKDPDRLVETRVEVLPDVGGREWFSLIAILANSIWVMTTEEQQAAFLRNVAQRLLPGGRLVVEQHELNPAGYGAGADWDKDGLRFIRRSRYNQATQRLVHQFTVVRPDGTEHSRNVHLRPMRVSELLEQAGRAGLEAEHVWNSWGQEPYAPGDGRVIAVFRTGA